MRYITICLLLMSATVLFAVEGQSGDIEASTTQSVRVSGEQYDVPDGPVRTARPPAIRNEDLPDPDDPTSATTYPFIIEEQKTRKNESSSSWDYRWDQDILVSDREVGTGQDMDEDVSTEDIYYVFDTYHTTYDSIIVFRSTDHGVTWNLFIVGHNMDGYIENPKVRVVTDAGGQDWVCFLGIWYEPGGEQTLYSRRVRTDGTGAVWEQVTTDDVDYADLDADVGTGGWLYCTYIPSNTDMDVWAGRNAVDGNEWIDQALLFANPGIFPYPQVAAGAGGNVAVTFVDDRITTNNEVRIKRSTNYGSSWIGSEQVSNNSGAADLAYTDIAYSHGATQTGWIFVTFQFSTSDNLAYYYSTNSGVNWTYGTVIGGGADENQSTLRAKKVGGHLTVAYNQDPGDSTMFTWAMTSTPTDFITPYRINDYAATSSWAPTAGWITTGGSSYSAIAYTSWDMNYRPYFDHFGNTGIAQEPGQEIGIGTISLAPNPSRGNARFSYTVHNVGNVRISVYDAAGRLVTNLVNETKAPGEYTLNIDNQNLTAGIYFVRIETQENVATQTMTVLR
jgi:hypothetical protein